jgi:enoyl-CoA hydratase
MLPQNLSQITCKLENRILEVTINRPDKLNALNFQVLEELKSLFESAMDNSVSGVIMTGAGEKAFVAGADIKELSSLSAEKAFELSQRGQKLFKYIEDFPKPVIAAINGFALGGGCELAMSCHIRFATENAKFGQPEVNLGIVPGYGATQRLTQLIGRGKALELMLTADIISAADAKTLGLVNQVFATREELIVNAHKTMAKILTKGPIAIAGVIKSVSAGFAFEDQGYKTESKVFSECATTNDFKEGTSAFLEKRTPSFTGK